MLSNIKTSSYRPYKKRFFIFARKLNLFDAGIILSKKEKLYLYEIEGSGRRL